MAGIPGVTIEVAWTNDPLTRPGLTIDTLLTEGGDTLVTEGGDTLTTEGTWTDITAGNPARDTLTTARGVDMKLGSFETGVMNLTLDNVNGDLDPSNTSSTYSPNVKPRKRIRASITPDGGTKTVIFTGFVERWPIRWRVEDEVVQVAASDLFGVIAEEILPPSVLEHTILGDGAVHYWPLGEDFIQTAEDLAGSADGSYRLSPVPTDGLVPFDPRGSHVYGTAPADAQGNKHLGQHVTISPFDFTSSEASVEFWMSNEQLDDIGPNQTILKVGPVTATLVFGASDNYLSILFSDGSLNATVSTEGSGTNFGQLSAPHHVVATYDATDGASVWVDGVEVGTQTATDTPTFSGIWSTSAIGLGITQIAQQVRVAHVALYDAALTPAQAIAHYDAGVNAWDGDTTSARLTRVLDIVGVDALDRDIETGTQICGPALLNSENVVTYIRKIAATENSALFVSADGKITFRANDNDPAAVLVFGEDVAGSEVPYSELVPDFPVERIINLAEVNRDGGNIQRYEDATSRTENGTTSVQVETLHQTPSGARSLAAGLVARNKTPKTTITRLTVDGRDDAVTAAASLDLEIGDGVDARMAPPHVDIFLRDGAGEILLDGNGDAITTADGIGRYFMERVEQRVSDDTSWEVTYGLAEVTVLPVFAWDTADQGFDQAVWS